MLRRCFVANVLFLALLVSVPPAASGGATAAIHWNEWSETLFERARRENRYIILHMAAVWCHWCHVMENTTYRDPDVLKLIEARYIPVRVDQDSRPDLSARYERWGWPATVMFDADGNEIFRRRGYLNPELFAHLLQAVIDDPSALPEATAAVAVDIARVRLPDDVRDGMEKSLRDSFDAEHGGFGQVHRFLHGPTVEYVLDRAVAGADDYRVMAEKTLAGARFLIDPVWGGMYQYSDTHDWWSPHYEKLMETQMVALRSYGRAYSAWRRPEDLEAARAIWRYLREFMSTPEGAFQTSQDADLNLAIDGKAYYRLGDRERRALGLPRIDPALYARENGWAIQGLTALADAAGDDDALTAALRAAEWALTHRRTPRGTFGHGSAAADDAYLSDTLAMGQAFLALHRSTGDRRWLRHAADAGAALAADFLDPDGGFMVRRPESSARGVFARPVRHVDDNVAAARFFSLLYHYTGDVDHRHRSDHAMTYLAAVADPDFPEAAILLADRDARREPVHVAVVGGKDDPAAQELFAEARRYPGSLYRLEWWDRREGPLANADVDYPDLGTAAAFGCFDGVCSLPVYDRAEVLSLFRRE